MTTPLLSIHDLSIAFATNNPQKNARVVDRISLDIKAGQWVSLVGQSGSGKSITALSAMKLLPYPLASHPSGTIHFDGHNILQSSNAHLQKIRGNDISMIFQEPMTCLNPLHTIGKQLKEAIKLHQVLSPKQISDRIATLLDEVELESLIDRLNAYPHELSGGQRQRIMIAIALANHPKLLIADEPTTALDVTVQQHILTLLKTLSTKHNMAILFITHDLLVVEKMSDYVYIMKDGHMIESGDTNAVFNQPRHSYTKKLLQSIPSEQPPAYPTNTTQPPILTIQQLSVKFPIKKNFFGKTLTSLTAVDTISFELNRGETIGIAGESGSGKTTLAEAILKLNQSSGSITFNQHKIDRYDNQKFRPLRKDMQIVFQDPYASLNPRMSIGQIIDEGLLAHYPNHSQATRQTIILQTLKDVGLDESMIHRYPHEFSGGQRQRVAIARAVVLQPKLIIFDEPTSALDSILQLQIISLLIELQQKYSISYLFISHDLRVIRAISHRIIILKNGKLVEIGKTLDIFNHPTHDYTKRLIQASLLQ